MAALLSHTLDKTQREKANFTNREMETLVEEVTARKSVLFGGHSTGLTNTTKQQEQELERRGAHCGRGVISAQRSRLRGEPEAADQLLIVNNEQIILVPDTHSCLRRSFARSCSRTRRATVRKCARV